MDRGLLLELARVVGQEAGQAYAAAILDAEERAQIIQPQTPIEAAGSRILALLPGWAEEASRMPRAVGSQQAKLLDQVLEYRRLLRDEAADSG